MTIGHRDTNQRRPDAAKRNTSPRAIATRGSFTVTIAGLTGGTIDQGLATTNAGGEAPIAIAPFPDVLRRARTPLLAATRTAVARTDTRVCRLITGTGTDTTRVSKTWRDNDRFDPTRHGRYRSGDHGYDRRYGSKEEYKSTYREGFRSGYEEAYRGGRDVYDPDSRPSGSRWPWPF
jgi:hypothetical protein